jgi:hypothetical protein
MYFCKLNSEDDFNNILIILRNNRYLEHGQLYLRILYHTKEFHIYFLKSCGKLQQR